MEKTIIVKNLKTGIETSMDESKANSLKKGAYGKRFSYREIKEPEELKSVPGKVAKAQPAADKLVGEAHDKSI